MSTTRIIVTALAAVIALAAAAQEPKQPDTITTPAPNTPPTVKAADELVRVDYPIAEWVPAHPGNFQVVDRSSERAVDMVIVHDIEGSADACLSWFQNPAARASSHYVVDSVTGKVYQMVLEKDIGWHAGNRDVNARSVGIEHEGYAYRPGFFNPVEYEAAARLIRNITERHNIPRDREHIIGHHEVPNPNRPGMFGGGSGHTDPGPYWDWDTLMYLIRNNARLISQNVPIRIRPGELLEASVTYRNTGDDLWVANSTGREDERVTALGAVYLGTWEPFARSSPFFNYKFWTSPRVASSVRGGDAAPGADAEFTFSLLGPRRLGTHIEGFRPVYIPAMPRQPVAFGDPFSVAIEVLPWDIVAEPTAATDWNPKGDLLWRKAGAGTPVTWRPELSLGGNYDVYARWTPDEGRTAAAAYEIHTARGVERKTVDQRHSGGWVRLGRFEFKDPKAASVTLLPEASPGIVIAGPMRFVGPYE